MNLIRFGIRAFLTDTRGKMILKIIKNRKAYHMRDNRLKMPAHRKDNVKNGENEADLRENNRKTQKNTADGAKHRKTKSDEQTYKNRTATISKPEFDTNSENEAAQHQKKPSGDGRLFHGADQREAAGGSGWEAAVFSACAWRSWSSAAARVAAVISSPPLIRAISSMRPAKSSGRTSVRVRPSC